MLQVFLKDCVASKKKKKEKKKFVSVICIITVSEFPMYILFYCDIRCIFPKLQIEIS